MVIQKTDQELISWAKKGDVDTMNSQEDDNEVVHVGLEEQEEALLEIEKIDFCTIHMKHMKALVRSQLQRLSAGGTYRILGCSPDASDQEVEKCYRESARKAHPDRGGSNDLTLNL